MKNPRPNTLRRSILIALASSPLLAPLPALAQPAAGVDFSELKPEQPVESKGKIEVIEFFWYGCPHCYSLEPLLEAWLKNLPKDAEFRRVPAVLSQAWARDAYIFYALEALGVLDSLHGKLFEAIHRHRLRTSDQAALDQWLMQNGIEPKKFQDVAKSFGVESRVKRAGQLSSAYRLDGTPAMAVHGRYTVSAEQGRTQKNMLATVDYLIGVARKNLK
jgi:thiol:disulfide interchange protein DsbA